MRSFGIQSAFRGLFNQGRALVQSTVAPLATAVKTVASLPKLTTQAWTVVKEDLFEMPSESPEERAALDKLRQAFAPFDGKLGSSRGLRSELRQNGWRIRDDINFGQDRPNLSPNSANRHFHIYAIHAGDLALEAKKPFSIRALWENPKALEAARHELRQAIAAEVDPDRAESDPEGTQVAYRFFSPPEVSIADLQRISKTLGEIQPRLVTSINTGDPVQDVLRCVSQGALHAKINRMIHAIPRGGVRNQAEQLQESLNQQIAELRNRPTYAKARKAIPELCDLFNKLAYTLRFSTYSLKEQEALDQLKVKLQDRQSAELRAEIRGLEEEIEILEGYWARSMSQHISNHRDRSTNPDAPAFTDKDVDWTRIAHRFEEKHSLLRQRQAEVEKIQQMEIPQLVGREILPSEADEFEAKFFPKKVSEANLQDTTVAPRAAKTVSLASSGSWRLTAGIRWLGRSVTGFDPFIIGTMTEYPLLALGMAALVVPFAAKNKINQRNI